MIGSRNPFDRPTRSGGMDPYGIFAPPRKDLATLIAEALTLPQPKPAPANFLQSLTDALNQPSTSAVRPSDVFRPIVPQSASPLPSVAAVRRGVFFSFHFEEDIRRSCIVRNSYRFRPGRKLPSSNFYDRSLWERSKREGVESLKRLIREGMVGSSVTCVLAGTQTWARPWVRFEIAHSLRVGNGLFTCSIHNVNDPHYGSAAAGYDPLAFMGLQLRQDGRGNVVEWVDGEWWPFELMKAPVKWPIWMAKPSVGRLFPLADFARRYDYQLDDGYNNLAQWAQQAAGAAGRR